MKHLLIAALILTGGTLSAQTSGGTSQPSGGTSQTGQARTPASKQEKTRQQRGAGQYHGNRDTTPGSPMGTGGAGGDMSGSPAASAIATDDQTDQAQVQPDSANAAADTVITSDTVVRKSTIRKTKSVRSKKRRH
jgi:hypothetical protein